MTPEMHAIFGCLQRLNDKPHQLFSLLRELAIAADLEAPVKAMIVINCDAAYERAFALNPPKAYNPDEDLATALLEQIPDLPDALLHRIDQVITVESRLEKQETRRKKKKKEKR